eukprot:403362126
MIRLSKKLHDSSKRLKHVQAQNMQRQIEDFLISTLELGQFGVNQLECKIKISIQQMPFENIALLSTTSHFSLCSYLSNASDPFSTMKFFFCQQNTHSQHFEYDLHQFDRLMIRLSKKLHDSSKRLKHVQAQNMQRQIEDFLISTLELGQFGVNQLECKIKISIQQMPFENIALLSTTSHFSLCSYLSNASDPFSTMKFFFCQQNTHSQHFEYDLHQFDRLMIRLSKKLHDSSKRLKHVQAQNMQRQIEDFLISTLELGQFGVNQLECKIKISIQQMPFENIALLSTTSHFSLCSYLSNASDPFSTMKFFFCQQNTHSQHFEYDLHQFDRRATHKSSLHILLTIKQ